MRVVLCSLSFYTWVDELCRSSASVPVIDYKMGKKEGKNKQTRKPFRFVFNTHSVPVTSSSDHDFLLNQILPVFVPAYSQYYR